MFNTDSLHDTSFMGVPEGFGFLCECGLLQTPSVSFNGQKMIINQRKRFLFVCFVLFCLLVDETHRNVVKTTGHPFVPPTGLKESRPVRSGVNFGRSNST